MEFYSTDRVGGRTVGETLKAASGSDTWDLGAQYVGRYNLYCCSNSVMFCKVFYFFMLKFLVKTVQFHSDAL